MLAKQIGVKHIVIFINKVDDLSDKEILDLVELEMRDLLSEYGFDGDNAPVIRGSALSALENKNEDLGKKAILQVLNLSLSPRR